MGVILLNKLEIGDSKYWKILNNCARFESNQILKKLFDLIWNFKYSYSTSFDKIEDGGPSWCRFAVSECLVSIVVILFACRNVYLLGTFIVTLLTSNVELSMVDVLMLCDQILVCQWKLLDIFHHSCVRKISSFAMYQLLMLCRHWTVDFAMNKLVTNISTGNEGKLFLFVHSVLFILQCIFVTVFRQQMYERI